MSEILAKALAATEPNLRAMAIARTSASNSDIIALLSSATARVRTNAYALLSLTEPAEFVRELPAAAQDSSRLVRMEAAICIRNIKPSQMTAVAAAVKLLKDADPGVRKFALKGAGPLDAAALVETVERMSRKDPVPHVRELAADIHANR